MKTIFSATAIILCLYFITGCRKDSSIAQPPQAGVNNTIPTNSVTQDSGIYILRISASQMVQNTNVYTYTETIAAPTGQLTPAIKVFLILNNYEIPIDNPVSFMNGTIWTNIDGLNVKLLYRNQPGKPGLPFYYLDIKIHVIK